ncbi:serine hydrolase domain-containing protein [Planotetraspora thailandica]|uniref:serine hydrolase domain-containing protein n=1 Tax=Planotetraspora thailandica TaxID=487172 RepID=UPI0035E4FB58
MLTVEHALTMTPGLEWNENVPYTSEANSEIAMELAPDRYRYILRQRIVDEPGARWSYCGGASALVARLIEKGTRLVLEDYARTRLFEPLGISYSEWSAGEDGVALAASGLRLTPRGLLAIGGLVLEGGRGIVPASWPATALRPHVRIDEGSGCSRARPAREQRGDRPEPAVTDDAKSQATSWTRLRDVVPRVVEHTAGISPCPDIGDSWPDEGGAVHRSVGSMEVGHTAPQPTPVAESQRSCQRSSRGWRSLRQRRSPKRPCSSRRRPAPSSTTTPGGSSSSA